MLRLYNTLTRKSEDFKPSDPKSTGYYSCGPTVYDFAHIGHARTYIFSDILQRALEFNGYKVKRVMNVTDVGHLTSDADTGEDKLEKGAKREGKSVWEIAEFYTEDFLRMLDKLRIKKPEIICKATGHIPEMISLIATLEKKGFTYKITDGVYFDTSKFPEYGRLTGQTYEQLQKSLKAGARVEMVSGKKHPTDFALWKFSPPANPGLPKRQMEWTSPWGTGFPGWHIECSAMAMKYLGETFDIHTGGVDHIPVHHTNEIAQSEAATGKQFVRYWLHAQHLLVEGEKMSKSLGNFLRVADIEKKGYRPLTLRYLFLTAHYRTAMNFTWKALDGAKTAYEGLLASVAGIKNLRDKGGRENLSEEKLEKVDLYRAKFQEAVNDDLNTAKALAVVWEVVKSNIPAGDKYDLLVLFDEVLGLDLQSVNVQSEEILIPDDVKRLIEQREVMRKQKKFKEADEVRKKIEESGFTVKDSETGAEVVKM